VEVRCWEATDGERVEEVTRLKEVYIKGGPDEMQARSESVSGQGLPQTAKTIKNAVKVMKM
jgi:hypothetical protein